MGNDSIIEQLKIELNEAIAHAKEIEEKIKLMEQEIVSDEERTEENKQKTAENILKNANKIILKDHWGIPTEM